MGRKQKLELMWYGKNNSESVEPRILVENKKLSHLILENENSFTDNVLIEGDNLLALKALVNDYSNKIKCIYIDPPYNTGSAFENYDDNLEHSKWLSLMKPRLEVLRTLMKNDGLIFIQIDDNEQAYLSVLCDEVFGRKNFINKITVKAKSSSGASGGGEDRKLKKNAEYILVYSKTDEFKKFKPLYKKTPLESYIFVREMEGINFAYKSVLTKEGRREYIGCTKAGNGEDIKIYEVKDYEIKSVSQIAKEKNITAIEVYSKYLDKIFTLENAQTSIRQRVKDFVGKNDKFYIAQYKPVSGKNKGQLTDVGFIGNTKRLMSFLINTVSLEDGNAYKIEKIGTLWDDISWSSVHLEGGVKFPNGKKPEILIQRILEMCTNEGDIVLDSFLGSGTTVAVAHKMRRRWIGIEMGTQAKTHCKKRIDDIINGNDNGGITKSTDWLGGGGYRFYELAPTLIKTDNFGQAIINPEYNADMLAAAVAKHEGYKYNPSTELFWKQATNDNKSYLFVTTKHVTREYLSSIKEEMLEDEFLVIVCKSFDSNANHEFKNIEIKKIPQSLLNNCEYDIDNYNLNIISPPVYEEEESIDD